MCFTRKGSLQHRVLGMQLQSLWRSILDLPWLFMLLAIGSWQVRFGLWAHSLHFCILTRPLECRSDPPCLLYSRPVAGFHSPYKGHPSRGATLGCTPPLSRCLRWVCLWCQMGVGLWTHCCLLGQRLPIVHLPGSHPQNVTAMVSALPSAEAEDLVP